MGGGFVMDPVPDPAGFHLFVKWIRWIHNRCTTGDFDEVILVTGRERQGKSGVAHLAQSILEEGWDPRKQLHWSSKAYTAAVPNLKPGQTNRHDEAVRGATSYNFMSPDNRHLADFFTTAGFYNVIHLLLYPTLRWVSPILKEHRATYNIHVVKRFRKHALVQVRQLRDEDVIFEKPKVLFSFNAPEPHGWKWDLERKLKREMTDQIAMGHGDEYDNYLSVKADMMRRLQDVYGTDGLG